MEVKLISVTNPIIDGADSAEELVAYCARVSNPSNQMNKETAPKLLKYLIKHKHWSPFEMASMCVEIKTSRAIAQQILRHRSFSFQEFSQRYAQVVGIEDIEMRLQAKENRQSSTEVLDHDYVHDKVVEINKLAADTYSEFIRLGIAKETARFVLPLSTSTTMYMNGTLRSWIHYLQQRCDEHTQKEHREIALGILSIFKKEFPTIYEAAF